MRARRLAVVLAVSAAVAASGGGQAQAQGFQSFTAGNGRVLCNLVGREAAARQKQLLCWFPATGASVSLIAGGGRPTSRVREELRGVHQPAPPLHTGRSWRFTYAGSSLLRCSGQATGVACNNQGGHGFRLGASGIVTF
jgi:hypothetical protein